MGISLASWPIETTTASARPRISSTAPSNTMTEATQLGIRRSSFARSGWKRIVRDSASMTGATMSLVALIPARTITTAAAVSNSEVVRDGAA